MPLNFPLMEEFVTSLVSRQPQLSASPSLISMRENHPRACRYGGASHTMTDQGRGWWI